MLSFFFFFFFFAFCLKMLLFFYLMRSGTLEKPTELLMNIRGGGLGKGRGEMRGNINK